MRAALLSEDHHPRRRRPGRLTLGTGVGPAPLEIAQRPEQLLDVVIE